MIKSLVSWVAIMLSILFAGGCFAQAHPSDQLIKGEFTITEEWQEFTFEKPLVAEPYVQELQLLSCNSDYELIRVKPDKGGHFLATRRFKRFTDDLVITPKVKVIINGKSYSLASSSSGYYTNGEKQGCIQIGYTLHGADQPNKFYFPRGIEIQSVKIKANAELDISMLYWTAINYLRVGNRQWKDVMPVDIVNLENLKK